MKSCYYFTAGCFFLAGGLLALPFGFVWPLILAAIGFAVCMGGALRAREDEYFAKLRREASK